MHTCEDKILELSEDCMEMSDWELEFIDSMAKGLDKGNTFTEKQLDRVKIIYDKYMV